MTAKKKLLILVGAGASVHLGLPSVGAVGDVLRKACLERYSLAADSSSSIYDWLVKEITRYRGAHLEPGFEDVLYTVLQLGALYPNGRLTASIGAFVDIHQAPEVVLFGSTQRLEQYDWGQLGAYLIDTIIDTFRCACRTLEPTKSNLLNEMRSFFQALEVDHELAVATLNYDDAIYRVLPHLETGFDPTSGTFDERRLFERSSWGCFLHLHGSVHFDMDLTKASLHEIIWRDDLAAPFSQNAGGRSGVYTTEGTVFPQSVIVAGYGKTQQILRRPFRSYYSELDRLLSSADRLLCLGYGFADIHLNAALEGYRDPRNRPVVMIDFAGNAAMSAANADWDEERAISAALRTLATGSRSMDALGRKAPTTVEDIKEARAFDRSTEPSTPLAIWYNGMEEACRSPQAVIAELV